MDVNIQKGFMMLIQKDAELLSCLLDLPRKPVAVKFLFSEEEYQSCPLPEYGNRMSYCTIVRRASEGRGQKFHAGHMACLGGATALGFVEPTAEMISGVRRLKQGAYQDLCTCRKVSKNMVYCRHKAYGAGVSPAESCFSEPDIVIIVCQPFQAMRIIQGYAYANGHASDIRMAGMQAMCQECTSLPFENDQINLTLMCSGTRMLARWGEDEMGIGMPAHLFSQVVEGVRSTVNPLERDKGKRQIEARLAAAGRSSELAIEYGRNYDDHCYVGGSAGKASNQSETV